VERSALRRLSSGLAVAALISSAVAMAPAAQAVTGCAKVMAYQDGTYGPVLCPNGMPNIAVQTKLTAATPMIMALRANATEPAITRAVCTDLRKASNPMAINAYAYQYSRYQWAGTNLSPLGLGRRLVEGTLCAN